MAEAKRTGHFRDELRSDEFTSRVERIRVAARGRTVELNGWEPVPELHGSYDTVLSLGRLPNEGDPVRYLQQLVAHLEPSGVLWALEPTIRTRRRGRRLRFGRIRNGATDVPAELRAAGLFVTDLDRFVLPSAHRAGTPFVEAVARFPTDAAQPDG